MTLREVYDKEIKELPLNDQIRLASLILEEVGNSMPSSERDLIEEKIRKYSRSNEALLKLAAGNSPPQSWFDDDTDPTVPDDEEK